MNCNDMQKILNGEVRSTDELERGRLRAHLETCAGCNAEWEAQALLVRLPVPPASAPLLDLAQAVLPKPAVRARIGLAGIIGGALVVAAAAASVLLGTRENVAMDEPLATEAAPAPEEPARLLRDAPAESVAPNAAAPPVERNAEASGSSPAASPINLDPSWVAVLPLPRGAASEEVMAVVEERRAEIVRRIQETEGLRLVDDALARSYVNAGMTDTDIGRALGAGVVIFPEVGRRDGAVQIRFFKLDPATDQVISATELMYVDREARAAGMDPARFDRQNERIWNNNLGVTIDVIVREANPGLAPPTEQLAAENRSILLDTNLGAEERIRALEFFFMRAERLDRVVIDAGIALLQDADDPQLRRRVLFALGAADDPNYVEMLVRTLAYDGSSAVRAEAARRLARFSADEAVREALEIAEAGDDSPDVRQAAAVAKLSQAQRLELRREIFLNRQLPAYERMLELNIGFVDSTKGPALSVDDEIARELVEIAVNGRTSDERGMALSVLAYIPRTFPDLRLNSDLREPLLELLRDDPDASIRGSAASALRVFADEPDVRAALENARDNDPVRQIRNSAARALE